MQQYYTIWHEKGLLPVLDAAFGGVGTHWLPLLAALLTPILIIYCRNEARNRRLRNLQDFIKSYPSTDDGKFGSGQGGAADNNPSLEFVKSKYLADIRVARKDVEEFAKADSNGKIKIILRTARSFGNSGDFQLLLSSLGFMILSYFGFVNLFEVFARGLHTVDPTIKGACDPIVGFAQIQVIGSIAFAGAFIAATRVFMRGLAVFDISAYTFLRQTVEVLASVALTILAYKAFPDPFKSLDVLLSADGSVQACTEIPWFWFAVAPILGLLPESSTTFLLTKLQSVFLWVKRDDDRYNGTTNVVPLNVIDGIDYFTRFRLEECGIYDIQNLATYNPILLHIESPYGIYQTVDWIGQAQLCHIVGLDRFLLLREMHIRTIFDLERAIDYRDRDACDQPAVEPDEFDVIYAGILFAATDKMRDVGNVGHIKPLVIAPAAAGAPPATTITVAPVTAAAVDDYCLWAREYIASDPARMKICVEHLMRWISDDLHVRRLRRIWQEISDSLGERSERLDSSAPGKCECRKAAGPCKGSVADCRDGEAGDDGSAGGKQASGDTEGTGEAGAGQADGTSGTDVLKNETNDTQ